MSDGAGTAFPGGGGRLPRETVAVIGGGLAGAVLAHQLARRAPGRFRIIVVEPRPLLGCGVAYSAVDPAYRINVPASKMSFVPSDPCHFDRWLKADGALREDPEALTPDGRAFPRRAVFGRYAAETVEPYLLSGAIEHRQTTATEVLKSPAGGYTLRLADGGGFEADHVALAATHPSPRPPAALAQLTGDPRLVEDTQGGALDDLPPGARVLIVGSGLTMADIVASLERRGHQGSIVVVSRRGLLSRGHAGAPGEYGSFDHDPSRTALGLLMRIRRTVAAAAAEGLPWQHALDAVRNQGPAIWAALPEAERRKVVRRLRPFWDVHRFRVAPQVEAAIARLRDAGQLETLRGEPVRATASGDGVAVELALARGGRDARMFDAVLLATGPAHRSVCDTSPLIARLSRDGIVALDRVGLGLETDPSSLAVGPGGRVSPSFWIAGPLARGTFGELMGLPEVSRHAEFVACAILKTSEAADAADRRAVA